MSLLFLSPGDSFSSVATFNIKLYSFLSYCRRYLLLSCTTCCPTQLFQTLIYIFINALPSFALILSVSVLILFPLVTTFLSSFRSLFYFYTGFILYRLIRPSSYRFVLYSISISSPETRRCSLPFLNCSSMNLIDPNIPHPINFHHRHILSHTDCLRVHAHTYAYINKVFIAS